MTKRQQANNSGMIRFSWVGILLLLFMLLIGNGWADEKPSVAVLDFESIGSEEHLGKAVAEIMRTELVGTQKFRVVERAQIKKALEEQKLQMTGVVDDASAVEIGKMLGADAIVVGSVVKIGNAYTINSRMIDVKTGEAKLGKNVTANQVDLLTSMSRNLVDALFSDKAVAPPQLVASGQPPVVSLQPHQPQTHQPAAIPNEMTRDFESGDLRGWSAQGQAFLNQPTFGDNPTARQRGQPARQQGDFWIGTFENRPSPDHPEGRTQGDRPKGTLTSQPFRIVRPYMAFLMGGGCNMKVVRVELLVNNRVVRQATGKCNESMERTVWKVGEFQNQMAQVRLIDNSSGGWGHINFDDLAFWDTATGPSEMATITWDFETGDLRGWQATGNAFQFQPTLGDNPTARRRGQPARQQGRYWIGGFEKRPSGSFKAGGTQGDGPKGTLTSHPFIITSSSISFLVGGGCNLKQVGVELLINGHSMLQTSGRCNESMQRMSWRVVQWMGRTAQIRLYDHSSGGWGHINFDDIRFEN